MKRVFSGLLFLVLLTGMLMLALRVQQVKAGTAIVPDDYPTIQAAVDAVSLGDTVYVRAGTYYENITVNKTLSLIGEGMQNTTIVGGGAGTVVYISADSVNVTGFTICNSTYLLSPPAAGISLDNANYCSIFGNKITTNIQTGVYLASSDNNSITGNTIMGNGEYGIDILSSNGNSVTGNGIVNNSEGVHLDSSNSNWITENSMTANRGYGLELGFSSSNSILGNNITDNSDGVYVASSSGNSIVENSITGSYDGVHLVSCNSSTVQGNSIKCFWDGLFISLSNDNNMTGNSIVAGHRFGIEIEFSTGNTLRNNQMTSNRLNFGVIGSSLSDFLNDADSSNTVDGKPVCYWVNRQGEVVPANAGYVAVVNSTGMTVRNLDLRNNGQGVLFAFTSNSTITGNNIDNNDEGVYLVSSGDISIVGNSITNAGYGVQLVSSSDNDIEENNLANDYSGLYLDSSNSNSIKGNSMTANSGNGVFLDSSNNNSLCGNKITDGDIGVHLQDYSSNNSMCGNAVSYCTVGIGLEDSCNKNTVTGNNITANNYYSIWLWDSSNNTFYHNNFVTLSMQVYTSNSANVWDDGYPYGGNHWSSYLGVDHYSGPYQNITGSDGIGDTAYTIDGDNSDRYPLMGIWYPITGDINGDCKVSLQDLVILANAYGSRPGDAKWNPNADLNGNGIVDLTDLVLLALHYGQHNP